MRMIYLCSNPATVDYVYGRNVKDELLCAERVYSKEEAICSKAELADTEYIFSTWGMPELSAEEIREVFPALKCVFYAAGTVQEFARPFLECGVKVFSAWAANAVPVAEYTLAQILLASKGFFPEAARQSRGDLEGAQKLKPCYPGNFGIRIGIIGAGMIGRKVIELLKPFNISVMVFDPFLSDSRAAELGVEKVSLEKLFSECEIISNHLANNAQTEGMLNYGLFSRMKPYSTFINTGRGAQVVEKDLARVLKEREDIYALLDVTWPEPPEPGHAFYSLENCILTPHIAGSLGNEVHRMAEYMLEEYKRFENGEPCLYEVTEDMLATMA